MGNYARTLIANLITVAALLAVLEFFCRIELKKIYSRSFDSSLIVDNRFFNSAGLKPNAKGQVWGKELSTDSLGCRVAAKPFNKKKKKWLFIGDSVTEGVGVDDSSTFAYKVSEAVDSLNVLNYSLIGYSDADYLNVLKSILSADSSVQRVTIFFCLNDVYGNTHVHELPVMAKPGFMRKVNTFLQEHYATYKLLKLFFYQNSSAYFKYDLSFYTKGNTQFAEAMDILKQCDSVCAAAGAKMEVVMLPYRSQLSGRYKNDEAPQQMVGNFCRENNIAFYDPLKELEQTYNPKGLYLFADEIHFSADGHDAIARYILSH